MNTHFELTNTIPIPKKRHPGRRAKYPFRVMRAGDSFFVPNMKAHTVYQAAKNAAKRDSRGLKFVVRTTVEGGVAGTRVWRTE